MIVWECEWDMSCSGYGCKGGIPSLWWGDEGEDLVEVGWSSEVDSEGVLRKL